MRMRSKRNMWLECGLQRRNKLEPTTGYAT